MDNRLIGEQITRYRKERGLTQEELGKAVGVSTQAVSRWENGGAPDVSLLPAIADKLGVTIDALFGREGGERQCVSIARCLMRETPVFLLDEATAELDNQAAFSVTDAILHLDGLTRVVVTHRLEEALLEQYDGIFVLRGGKICEEGRFADLMEKKEYFYSLYTVANG